MAYSSDDEVVGFDDADVSVLGAGCTTVLIEYIETDEPIEYYETSLTAKENRSYSAVNQDLSCSVNIVKNGAVVSVTNDGDTAAKFAQGFILFFNGDELVYSDSAYFTDDDSNLVPDDTITKQMSCYEDFDRVEVYFDGRK